MATINYDDGVVKTVGTAGLTTTVPGHGRSGPPIFGKGGRAQLVVTGTFSFDSSYPTGGEDISDLFDLFGELKGAVFEPFTVVGKIPTVDYTNKKLKLFVEGAATFAEAVAASDQSLVANVRFVAWGFR